MMRIRRYYLFGSFMLVGFVFVIYNRQDQVRMSTPKLKQDIKYAQHYYDENIENITIQKETCFLQLEGTPNVDIQMLQVLDDAKFDNIDGGAWKQGWKIEVKESDWNEFDKLNVFVVPHSHNDPGWMKTTEEYYTLFTKHILDNILKKLPQDKRRKFIWAEMLYFAMWWEDLTDYDRKVVKRLVDDNQLEFVTGGWVMNDEANSYWVSTVEQFIEGHQWLKQHLNYTPRTSWSIDPFGLSNTQAALLNKMGFENMVIQRVHYSVKKHLARRRQLEFKWRQAWDGLGHTDIFAHVMPFSFYDTLHTCGPDPHVCCQFDFVRLITSDEECPANVLPQKVTDQNVAERAELLLDQYRKKSKLFRTNTLLVTLGDDFRFNTPIEWDLQYDNYQKIFDYLNANKNLNTQVKFGTLGDYFNAVKHDKFKPYFPTLSGDFFSYADRDDHFWTGTYTSKQYFKRLDRVLLSYIRAADVSLLRASVEEQSRNIFKLRLEELNEVVAEARKVLALFQHHDGLSGAASDNVIYDYGKKMLLAIQKCQHVLQETVQILLRREPFYMAEKVVYYKIDDLRHDYNNIGEHYPIETNEESTNRVVIFNPLTCARHEVVTLLVTVPFIEVLDYNYKPVICQISPTFDHKNGRVQNGKYYASFVAHVPPFGLSTYFLIGVSQSALPKETTFSKVLIHNYDGTSLLSNEGIQFEKLTDMSEFILKNDRIVAWFGADGLLKTVNVDLHTVPVKMEFTRYKNRMSSGHLFLPESEAVTLKTSEVKIIIIQGQVLSSVTTQLPYVLHSAILYNSPGIDGLGIEIKNTVNITNKTNFELMMRFTTNLKTNGEFFSDSNGYQLVKRKFLAKLPIQGNFYPMPTMSYIEDDTTRFSILTDTPIGVASLREGQIEVTLDQRSKTINNSSVWVDMHDKAPIVHTFRLFVEMKNHSCKVIPDNYPAGMFTLSTHLNQQALLNPLVRLISTGYGETDVETMHGSIDTGIAVDHSIVLLRNRLNIDGNNYTGLILHRQFLDVCFIEHLHRSPVGERSVNIGKFFNITSEFHEASLTFASIGKRLSIDENISLCPMDTQAYTLQLS